MFEIKSIVAHQFLEVIGQALRALETPGVDVRSGRKVERIIGSAEDDGHRVVGQRPVQFLRHVVWAQGILETQIESIMAAEHPVAFRSIAALMTAVALAVNVHRNEERQVVNQRLPAAVRHAVGDEPGRRPFLPRQIHPDVRDVISRRLVHFKRIKAREIQTAAASGRRRRLRPAFEPPVRVETDDVRVPAIGHCPVEVVVEIQSQLGQVRVHGRLVIEEDEMLMGSPPSGRR